jgi:hypothetical protein
VASESNGHDSTEIVDTTRMDRKTVEAYVTISFLLRLDMDHICLLRLMMLCDDPDHSTHLLRRARSDGVERRAYPARLASERVRGDCTVKYPAGMTGEVASTGVA